MHADDVRQRLPALADASYQRFTSGLIPGADNILGIRMPVLRKLARSLCQADWRLYLSQACEDTYEEVVLQGLVIGMARMPLAERIGYIQGHVEKLRNWSDCDTFCAGLKVAAIEPEAVWACIVPYFDRTEPYPLRFAIVMSLMYFIDDAHLDAVLAYLDRIRHEDYYVRMAVAWAISMAYVAYPERIQRFLHDNALDDFTYNKALQKIIESRQVSDEIRDAMRKMKRKGGDRHAKGGTNGTIN